MCFCGAAGKETAFRRGGWSCSGWLGFWFEVDGWGGRDGASGVEVGSDMASAWVWLISRLSMLW